MEVHAEARQALHHIQITIMLVRYIGAKSKHSRFPQQLLIVLGTVSVIA